MMGRFEVELSDGRVLEIDADSMEGAQAEVALRLKNLNAGGPSISPGPGAEGFEDTEAEAFRILEQYHEPNRARDVLPKLAEFALVAGGGPEAALAAKGGVAALRGMSAAAKAARIAKTTGKLVGTGVAAGAADAGLREMGVPAGVSEALLVGAGLGVGLRKRIGNEATNIVVDFVKKSLAKKAGSRSERELSRLAITEADSIASKIVEWKTKNKFSDAQVVSSLRNVYGISPRDGKKFLATVMKAEAVAPAAPAGKKATAAVSEAVSSARVDPSPLQASRVERGAQAVGREMGLSKEEVRRAAGPVLGEAAGEASPILPSKALNSIIDKMKAMPMAEREAYVAKATSGKAQWQIENIRRTLEHLGLLIPASVAGAAAVESR